MRSPLPTVSVAKQDFDALRGTKVIRVAYGNGPAMTVAPRIAGAMAACDGRGEMAAVRWLVTSLLLRHAV